MTFPHFLPQAVSEDTKHKYEFYATCLSFFMIGISFSTWASRVPDVRDGAFLTAATLGYILLMRGVGNLVMMPILAVIISRFGAKRLAILMGVIISVILIPITYLNHWVALAFMLFAVGFFSSGFNISINALGAKLETDSGKSYMSKIHSWFGVGNLTGELLGTAATAAGLSVRLHFVLAALLMLTILALIARYLPEDTPDTTAPRPKFEWPHGGLIALGIIIFLASTIEASIMNWVGIFFTDHVQADAATAPVGYAMFAGSMLLARISGDRLKGRFGATRLLITGNIISATGFFLAIFVPHIYIASFGFLLIGAGVAFNFPMAFSAAGREGAIALTSVATFGYIGNMVSQPVVGTIVTHFELAGGFTFLACCTILIGILAWRAEMLR